MTMSVGLGRIIQDPNASILTRKALGVLSTPGLLVYDDALTIDDTGRIVLRLKDGGGLQKDETGLSLSPVEEATSITTIGIDSEVDPRSEAYDREWNARLTGPAPNYIESSLAIGEEEFGGVTSAFPYETVEKAKVSITSKETQLRLRYDMENYVAFRVYSSGFSQLFCIGGTDPAFHVITGGGDSASVQGGLMVNFGTVLRRMLSFSIVMSFPGGGAIGAVSSFESTSLALTLPDGVSLTSGVNVAFGSPTTDPGLQVMSWSARVHSSNQIAVRISYFDVLGAFSLTFHVTVLQFL
jgi:hypothetical protein